MKVIRHIATVFLLTFFCASILSGSGLIQPTYAQEEISVEAKEVDYDLPHAGMLPDNPLYSLKKVRDSFWLFFTRDNLEKADLLLLFSDKKIVMAQAMAEKGKWELALESARNSEADANRMIEAMEMATKIGYAPSGDFLIMAKLSNDKHYQIMEDMLVKAPSGSRSAMEEIMQTNIDNHNQLEEF